MLITTNQTVEAKGKVPHRPAALGAASEIGIYGGALLGVPAADRRPGVAAVGGREHLVGQHLGERAEHAVDYAEAARPGRQQRGRPPDHTPRFCWWGMW